MYIVKIINDNNAIEIHGANEKLKDGKVVKGINSIDSFSFSMLPSNKGFNHIHDMKTLVTVYNTNKNRYEFRGRVLYSFDDMSETGLITKEITCESFFGFLNDSKQKYVTEQNWTVSGLFEHLISTHNSKVEEYKQFTIGEVTVTDPNDNLYIGIQRESTWKMIEEKLINQLGGEIRFRVVDGITYIDYLEEIGSTKATEIKLSKNMKKISREKDPSSYITRLIPLGCKLTVEQTTTDEEGNEVTTETETEERLDITSVNGGIEYIEDTEAVERFGIIEGYIEFDDVTEASNLFSKGESYLINNNKMLVKYAITALDLSLLGLAIDDFEVHNWHPIVNELLGIDDTARIIKKTIDVVNNDALSSIEIGDNFKTLTDLQIEQDGKIQEAIEGINRVEINTTELLTQEKATIQSLIQKTYDNILLQVQEQRVWSEAGVVATSIATYFLASSESENVTFNIDAWSSVIPTLSETAKYLWCCEVVSYSDGSSQSATPVLLSTYDGCQITNITDYYAMNTDSENPVTVDSEGNEVALEWSVEIPTLSINAQYLWKYSVVTCEDGTVMETEKRVIGKYGMSFTEFTKEFESQMSVLSQSITMNFSTTEKSVKNIDGQLQTFLEQFNKFIRFSGDTAITIGSTEENSITLKLDNQTGIQFEKNGVVFGEWDGTNFYTGNIVVRVEERAQLGNFAFVPRSDGSLSFLKVGD